MTPTKLKMKNETSIVCILKSIFLLKTRLSNNRLYPKIEEVNFVFYRLFNVEFVSHLS